jgi:hypothetical protein
MNMRVLQLTAENVKKIKVIDISPDPGDPVIQIVGRNGAGKSSVLDAMWYAIAGEKEIPEKPLRKGAKSGRVRVDLGDIVVTRTFTEGGGGELVVTNGNGLKYPSPQALLDSLKNKLSFDPLAFSRMRSHEQYDTLKKIAGLDEIDTLERENKEDYDKRREINRELKQKEDQIKLFTWKYDDSDKKVDVSRLATKLKKIIEHNNEVDKMTTDRVYLQSNKEQIERELKQVCERVSNLERALAKIKKDQEELAPLPSRQDPAPVQKEIREADARNTEFHDRQRHQELEAAATKLKKQSDDLTKTMAKRSADKQTMIEDSNMPVKGLSLNEGQVMFKGIPFDQCSTAEQIRVSLAIAMSGNPKLKVIRIKEGSLLDDKSMGVITTLAAKEGYQVWVERVDACGEVAIHIEDGEVVE